MKFVEGEKCLSMTLWGKRHMPWAGNLGRLPWRHELSLDAILFMWRILVRSGNGHDPVSIFKGIITSPVTPPLKYFWHFFLFLPPYDHSWHEPPVTHFWNSSHQRALITYVILKTYIFKIKLKTPWFLLLQHNMYLYIFVCHLSVLLSYLSYA